MMIVTALFISCSKDGNPGMGDMGSNPDDISDPDNGGNNMDSQVKSDLIYSNTSIVSNYLEYENNEFVIDQNGMKIVDPNGILTQHNEITYSVNNVSFTASLTNINALIERNDGLYIGTGDGHLLVYENGAFRGFPVMIHKMKRFWQNNPISAIWEWTSEASTALGFEYVNGRVRSEIEYEEVNEFAIRDEYPCIDPLNQTENYCEGYELIDFASLDRLAMLGQNGALMILPDYKNNTTFLYNPNFSNFSFNKLSQIELFYQASSLGQAPNKFYYDHIWVNTNNGLAYYKMDQDKDLEFIPEKWNVINTSNSNLSSDSIIEMQVVGDERLIAYSNNPAMLNYINVQDGTICSFSAPATENIQSMQISGNAIYLAQGQDVYKISKGDLSGFCGF